MKFLTDTQEIQQYDKNLYFTKHNQIFEDSDGVLHLTPRFLITDGYTICDILSPIAGGRFEEDIRCSCAHDFWCRYHQDIQITISEARMVDLGILKIIDKNIPERIKKPVLACENVPRIYLNILPISFKRSNELFNEMLKATDTNLFKRKILTAGVHLNVGWIKKRHYPEGYLEEKLYNDFCDTIILDFFIINSKEIYIPKNL